MIEDMTNHEDESLIRLHSAACNFATAEAKRIVCAVIDEMRGRPAQGFFGDLAARHMWDEYCWSVQEGPFDQDMGWDYVPLGSLSDAFEGLIRAVIEGEIEKLPHHVQVFLSAKAIVDNPDADESMLGWTSLDGTVELIIEDVNSEACGRNLDLIGPFRAEAIGHLITGQGAVWSALADRREAIDLVASYVDEMIDPNGDLSELVAEMIEAFVAAIREEADGTAVPALLTILADQIRELLTERDVRPALEEMRADLLKQLDG